MMDKKEAKRLYNKFSKDLKAFSESYYLFDSPAISDAKYDEMYAQLLRIEEEYPEFIDNKSQSRIVGSDLKKSKFSKIKHLFPMLSLENAFKEEDIDQFFKKVRTWLKTDQDPSVVLEAKLDGLSASIIYENGKLISASTRGDGIIGEDITQNMLYVNGVIDELKTGTPPTLIDVRGEVVMLKDDFKELNDNLGAKGLAKFANPRNASAGSLRQLDAEVTKNRKLYFFAYSIDGVDNYKTHSDVLNTLSEYGFCVNPINKVCKSRTEMQDFINEIEHKRADLSFDIDGMVYKINDIEIQKRLGNTEKYPRHSIAYKFSAEKAETTILSIVTQVGRTGVITPVANVKPVNIGGVLISRATLHNKSEIREKDIREGDRVIIQRAGDVVPQIINSISHQKDSVPFEFPECCPSCGHKLKKKSNDAKSKKENVEIIVCNNNSKCQRQLEERLIHFVSKSAFDIEGLGDKNIIFLIKSGIVRDPVDIFRLTNNEPGGIQIDMFNTGKSIDVLKQFNEWGDISTNNLLKAIESKKCITLDRFIYSTSIPQVGQKVSKILAGHYKTCKSFLDACNDINFIGIDEINNIGKSIKICCEEFFSDEYFRKIVFDLVTYPEMKGPVTVLDFEKNSGILSGLSFVFTGSLNSVTRKEAKYIVEKNGGSIMTSVSSKTSFLVAGSDPGSKLKKSEELGVKIISEDEFLKMTRLKDSQ